MHATTHPPRITAKSILFFALVFLFFFQLSSDFIESIYTFGLLGVDIPPEIVSVLLFFTPVLLLFSRRSLPHRVVLILAAAAALLRALEVVLAPTGKMLASGLGVGVLFLLLPGLLSQLEYEDPHAASLEVGAGLGLAWAFSVLFRSLGSGTDISLTQPWLSWLLAAGMLVLVFLSTQPAGGHAHHPAGQSGVSFGLTLLWTLGLVSALSLLYFGLLSPTVLARWSEVDYRLVLLTLAAALSLYFLGFANGFWGKLSKAALLAWNGLFVAAGAAAILLGQVGFPPEPGAYPLDQPLLTFLQQIPMVLMVLLSPIILLDVTLLIRAIASHKPSPRALAGGFSLGALFFLLIVFAQVFTTVYDYIPLVGPWFRDRFWLAFLIPGLGLALPVLSVPARAPNTQSPVLRAWFFPLILAAALAAVVTAVIRSPNPTAGSNGSLRVLTYNIQQGYSEGGVRYYEGQLELIRDLDADLIGLQESDTARFSGGNADVVRTFADGLEMYSYYGPRTVTGTFGIALLSRYPIRNPRTFYMYSSGEQTAAIEAEISVGGVDYLVLVTHLGNGGPLIQQQQVLERLSGRQNVVAMGDFNFDNDSEQYALTTQTLEDAWVLAGSPASPGLNLDHLIDHIFVSPGTQVASARYISSPASDHPALVVEIMR
jgi:endonuclease/exonuclease/phosphatase family metal-dependent hydrolase